jgi:hypothetical protein
MIPFTLSRFQHSSDGTTWKTLVDELANPGPLAGDGRIVTWTSQSTCYIQVLAMELGGVAQESGYPM